jgi:hypothetical protein
MEPPHSLRLEHAFRAGALGTFPSRPDVEIFCDQVGGPRRMVESVRLG